MHSITESNQKEGTEATECCEADWRWSGPSTTQRMGGEGKFSYTCPVVKIYQSKNRKWILLCNNTVISKFGEFRSLIGVSPYGNYTPWNLYENVDTSCKFIRLNDKNFLLHICTFEPLNVPQIAHFCIGSHIGKKRIPWSDRRRWTAMKESASNY